MQRLRAWTLYGAVGALGAVAAFVVFRAWTAAGGTPPWDAASHGLQGYAYAQDIARLDVVNGYKDILGHTYRYAPLHPLLLAAAYGLFGPTWGVAVGVSGALFATLVLLLFHAGRRCAGPASADGGAAPAGGAGLACGLLAALLAVSSPAMLGLAGTIMLEMPAAVLGVAFAWAWGASLDRPQDARRARIAGWTLTAFVLTASQFAAVWAAAAALYEMWRCPPALRRRTLDMVRVFLRSRAFRHPVTLPVALPFLLAAAVAATGGWRIPLGGPRVLSMTSPMDPLILGLFLLGARAAWLLRRHRELLREVVSPRLRALFATVVVPLFLWYVVVYPPRLRTYLNWVEGSPAQFERASADYWTYYPAFFLGIGHPLPPADRAAPPHLLPTVAAAVALLAAASFCRRSLPPRVAFLRWSVLATSALILAHHARQERFLVPFLPAWWLLAAGTAVWLTSRLPGRGARAAVAVAAAAACGIGLGAPLRNLYVRHLESVVAPPWLDKADDYRQMLDAVSGQVAGARSVRILGTEDGYSHHLFEWAIRRRVDVRTCPVDFDLDHPQRKYPGDPAGPRMVFDAWLAKAPDDLVFAVEPEGLDRRPARPVSGLGKHDPEWTWYTMRYLRACDRYACAADWPFSTAELRVRMYRRR